MENLVDVLDDIIILLKGSDKYQGLVDMLNDAFSSEWDGLKKTAISQAVDFFSKFEGEINSDKEAEAIIATMKKLLGPTFAARVSTELSKVHSKTYQYALGDDSKLGVEISFNKTSERVLNWLGDNHSYWLGNFFSDQIEEKLGKDLNGIFTDITTQGLSRDQAGRYLKGQLKDLFEKPEGYKGSVNNYFTGVATNFVTQTREFAHVDAYERAEVEYVKVVAVLDHRTSKICRHLDGTIIPVKHLAKQRDKIMSAKTPEEAKKYSWWPKDKEIAHIDPLALPGKIGLPPYHFFCRTTTVAATEKEIKRYLKEIRQ